MLPLGDCASSGKDSRVFTKVLESFEVCLAWDLRASSQSQWLYESEQLNGGGKHSLPPLLKSNDSIARAVIKMLN